MTHNVGGKGLWRERDRPERPRRFRRPAWPKCWAYLFVSGASCCKQAFCSKSRFSGWIFWTQRIA